MSNFESLDLVTETLVGTAPSIFVASTRDTLVELLSTGYLNDIQRKVKANDKFNVNYLDTSVFPLNTGLAALYAEFEVQYDPIGNNWNLLLLSAALTGIAELGVHSALYSNAGGSATLTFSDSLINPSNIVLAQWKSSTNPVEINIVKPGNGGLTVVSSADPGVSVLQYIAITPSVILQNAGVFAGQYHYTGGSPTIVIPAPSVTASMIVNANFVNQTTQWQVEKVTAGDGIITILASGNPGAADIAYTAITPSTTLTALGYYAAAYSNAGGSATITITDANILAGSLVMANFSSSANAVVIEKVTASAGTLTILASGDPGISVINYSATDMAEGVQSGLYLQSSNNLSDVASIATSRSNLGLGTLNAVVFDGITSGASGNSGNFISFPATAANGTLILAAANAGGAFNTTISNGTMGQSSVITIPDPGAATSKFVLQDGSNTALSVLNLKYGATPVAQVDPASCTITAAAGAANVATITVQLKDGSGANLARSVAFRVYSSSAADGLTLQSAASTGYSVASGGLALANGSAVTTQISAMSSATGGCVLSLTDTGKLTSYLVLVLPNGNKISAQLSAGSYG